MAYKNELYHYGVLGMRWGVRRYQRKDGSLTPAGKKHLADNNVRTEENLVEKTIPKGTVMYRTSTVKKEGHKGSTYVTYMESDRNLYKEGTVVRGYTDGKAKKIYEHEFELKTDLKVPSMKTIREIEKKVLQEAKYQKEVGEAYMKAYLKTEGHDMKAINESYNISLKLDKIRSLPDLDSRRKAYDTLFAETKKKYGEDLAGYYMDTADQIAAGKKYLDTSDSLTIERSLGLAVNTKDRIIKELSKQGYNAMYDNASIGVSSKGDYTKNQEAIEPLIVFDTKNTLKENSVRELGDDERRRAGENYNSWKVQQAKALAKFKNMY